MNELYFTSKWNVITVLSLCDLIVELKNHSIPSSVHMGSQLNVLPAMCDRHMGAVY